MPNERDSGMPPITPQQMREGMERLERALASRLYGYTRPNTEQRERDMALIDLMRGFCKRVDLLLAENETLKKGVLDVYARLEQARRPEVDALKKSAEVAADARITGNASGVGPTRPKAS